MIPSVGRIVHYVLPESHCSAGDHRPAVIVRVWHQPHLPPTAESLVQLQVFTDGSNDDPARSPDAPNLVWVTSVSQDAEHHTPGTWHEPERV